jgi:hypothetical protein
MFQPLGYLLQGPEIIYKDHQEHGKGPEYINRSQAAWNLDHYRILIVYNAGDKLAGRSAGLIPNSGEGLLPMMIFRRPPFRISAWVI